MPANEQERIKALNEYNILDTLPEKDFDDITRLASEICQTPISLVGIIDAHRQWFKSRQGIDASEISRNSAFCTHTINSPQDLLIVNDLSKDSRFKNNPLVTGHPKIRFYAGIPLFTPSGYAIGTLSVWDHEPRMLTDAQVKTLQSLASQVVTQLELRKTILQLDQQSAELKRAYADLENFSTIASHDLKSPLNNIISISHLLKDTYGSQLDNEGNEYIHYLNAAAFQLSDLVSGILSYSRSSQLLVTDKEQVSIPGLIGETIELINIPTHCTINYPKDESTIYTSRIALKQIFLNLLQNAIRHNDKPHIRIDILYKEQSTKFVFEIKDNGKGIPEADKEKVFNLFTILDKNDKAGTGIGLSVVKRLVEKLCGAIKVKSEVGEGATFLFSIGK